MTGLFRLRAKRTTGTEPPADMLFGELAYSDGDQQLYIGRPTGPPATFLSDLSPITDEIGSLATITLDQQVELAALTTTTSDQALDIAALATSDSNQDTAIAALILSDSSQDTAIATLTTDVAALDTSQGTQDTAIAALVTAVATQGTAIDALDASSFSGAYADLTGKPSLFSGVYGDLTGIPSTFAPAAHSQAWGTITSTPTTLAGYGIGDAQPLDSDLTAIAALSTTAFGRGLLTQGDGAAVRTAIGAGTSNFSGVYGDLSGRPVLAFTFDQQTEPSSPAAGATWRERNASNSIVNTWEWTGSLWVSEPLYSDVSIQNVTVAINVASAWAIVSPALVESLSFYFRVTNGNAASASSFATWETRIRNDGGAAAAAGFFSAFTEVKISQNLYVVPINRVQNITASEAGIISTITAVTGSPGNGRFSGRVKYRLIRN